MTSGRFHSIEISTILTDRENRQRKVLKESHINELAYSINKRGLIHPIVVNTENVLLAGECRLAACKVLGWTHINAQYSDELDPKEMRAIELEENIKRLDLTWQENAMAVLDFHELRRQDDPTWSHKDTGEAIGLSQPTVSKQILVAQELRQGNETVAAAPMYSTALGIVERREERKRAVDLEHFQDIELDKPKPESQSILNADFLKWAPAYSGPRFNFIHCDFPYGINADKHVQGAADTHGGYRDTLDHYHDLMHCLCSNADRLSSESASSYVLVFYAALSIHSRLSH